MGVLMPRGNVRQLTSTNVNFVSLTAYQKWYIRIFDTGSVNHLTKIIGDGSIATPLKMRTINMSSVRTSKICGLTWVTNAMDMASMDR